MPRRWAGCWKGVPALPETIQAYLETVEQQIRWRRARPVVSLELRRHLEDQRNAFAAEGRADAERLAVAEMGDPVSVGTELDRLHRPQPQWGLLGLTIALACVGACLRVLLTAGQGFESRSPLTTLLALVLGIVALAAGYFLDCSRLFRHAGVVYIGVVAAGVLSLWLSPARNNASYYTRYLVQLYPTAYVLWLYHCRGRGWQGYFMAVAGGIPPAVVCAMAPSMLGLVTLLCCGLVLLLSAVRDGWFRLSHRRAAAVTGGLLALGAAIFRLLYGNFDLATSRFLCLLHPELDPRGQGYQAISTRAALAASRWLGSGDGDALPASYEKFVPNWNYDQLLTTLVYRLGWLPFLALLLTAAGMVLWLLGRCLKRTSRAGRLLALSVVLTLLLQMVFSVMVNMGFPLFGAEFPLLVGNLQTVLDMGLIGLALSVFRSGSTFREEAPQRGDIFPWRVKILITSTKNG